MDRKSLLGLVLCGAVFAAGFAISGNVAQYFNLAAIFVVAGGTLGVAIASFRMQRLQYVARVLRNSYRARMKEPAEIVEIPYENGVTMPAYFIRSANGGPRQPVLISDADPRAFLFVALVLKAQGGESVNAALVGRDVAVERSQRVRQFGFALQGGGVVAFGVARGGRQQFVALGFHGP